MLERLDPNKKNHYTSPVIFGGGEMGTLIRNQDWSNNPLGAISEWPHSLRTTIGILINSRLPTLLLWGKEYTCFYNDAYNTILQKNVMQPASPGKSGKEVHPETWSTMFPFFEKVFLEGEVDENVDALSIDYLDVKNESITLSYNCSPIIAESGNIAGVFVTCMKGAEIAGSSSQLAESNLSLDLALEIGELGTFKFDLLANKASYSPKIQKWFGLTDLVAPLSEILLRIHPDDQELITEVLRCASSGESSSKEHDMTYRVISPDSGAYLYLRSVCRILFSGSTPIAISGIIQEVTTEVLSKIALEESEERFRNIAEGTDILIALIDETNKITYLNNAWTVLTGRNMDTLVHSDWFDLVKKEEQGRNIQKPTDSLKDKLPFSDEFRILDNEGEYRWLLSTSTPRLNSDGSFTGYISSCIDITQRKKAEEALRESESRFKNIADSSPSHIWILNENAQMIYFNKTFLHFVGLPEDIEGILPWEEFVPQEDLISINGVVKNAFEKKEFIKIEHRITRFDGEVRWVLATGKPRYLQGEFKGYIGSNIDITDRKAAEESLEIKNAQLQRINNDLDNFIYTASHDLKAPILNIEGLINYLENSLSLESNKAAKPLISMIHKSIDRFKTTIKDLTEVAKVQNNLEEDQSSISFSEMLDEVKLNIQNDIKEANALIEHDFSAVPSIYFSQKNIRSILYNLLSNAVKYRSPNRQVVIKITSEKGEGNYTVLTVKDNGLGIKKEDQTKIFTMFKRLHQHVEGTGIGLSIVKKIIDNNDGKIEVESELGMGTTLKVYFKVY